MIPDGISVKSHLELSGRKREVWIRRTVLALIALVAGLALLNIFGQRPRTDIVSSEAATLSIYSPDTRARRPPIHDAVFGRGSPDARRDPH